MRDPARIDVLLNAIREYWKSNPDLRLSQIIVNLVPMQNPCPDIFYYEDTELLKSLQERIQAIRVEDKAIIIDSRQE